MKKHLISNTILSLSVLLLLVCLSSVLNYNFSPYYYFTVGFFFLTYLLQAFFLFKLGVTPSKFLLIYNFTTILKMTMSLFALVAYYLFFAQQIEEIKKIHFSGFFLFAYFLYLIINTKNFFSTSNEKRS